MRTEGTIGSEIGHSPVILAFEKLRQEDLKFEPRLKQEVGAVERSSG